MSRDEAYRGVCANPMFEEGATCAAEPLPDAGRIDGEGNLVGDAGAARSALGTVKKERAVAQEETKALPIPERRKPASERTRELPTISSFNELEAFLGREFTPIEYPKNCGVTYWLTPEELCDIVERYAELVLVNYVEYSCGASEDMCCVRLFEKHPPGRKPIEFVGLYPFASQSDARSFGQDWRSAPEYANAMPRLADVRGKYHFNFGQGSENSLDEPFDPNVGIPPASLWQKLSVRKQKFLSDLAKEEEAAKKRTEEERTNRRDEEKRYPSSRAEQQPHKEQKNGSQIQQRPKSVFLATLLAYGSIALGLVSLLVVSAHINSEVRTYSLAIGCFFAFLRAIVVFWMGSGKNWARIVFVAFWLLDLFSLFRGSGQREEVQILAVAYTFSLVCMALDAVAIILFFVPSSQAWFRAKKANQNVQPVTVTIRSGGTSSAPVCGTCHRVLESLDLGQGAQIVVGRAPVLYLGVVCSSCRMVQCSTCKGSPSDAPCSRCGSPVKPAYAHHLVSVS